MLPKSPIQFVGGALLLVAIMLFMAGGAQVALVVAVLGLGCVFSRFLVKDAKEGRDDAR